MPVEILDVNADPTMPHSAVTLDQQDIIEWTCATHDFVIEKIAHMPDAQHPIVTGAQPLPFTQQFPLEGKKGNLISGTPKGAARGRNQRYKYTALALNPDGSVAKMWDPHIIIL